MNGNIGSTLFPRVIPQDQTGYDLSDPYVHALPVLEIEHEMTHRGLAYLCSGSFDIPSTGVVYLQLKTDGKYVHFRRNLYNVSANNILYSVYESPTVTDGTVQVPAYNLNRSSSNTTPVIVYNNPTGVSGGTKLMEVYITGSKDITTTALTGYEIIYKPSASYVARIENLQAGVAKFYFQFFWYEI